jgi:hypothetical protein
MDVQMAFFICFVERTRVGLYELSSHIAFGQKKPICKPISMQKQTLGAKKACHG